MHPPQASTFHVGRPGFPDEKTAGKSTRGVPFFLPHRRHRPGASGRSHHEAHRHRPGADRHDTRPHSGRRRAAAGIRPARLHEGAPHVGGRPHRPALHDRARRGRDDRRCALQAPRSRGGVFARRAPPLMARHRRRDGRARLRPQDTLHTTPRPPDRDLLLCEGGFRPVCRVQLRLGLLARRRGRQRRLRADDQRRARGLPPRAPQSRPRDGASLHRASSSCGA